ncbi:MAG: hypothetical protein P0107_06685 [Nitrosomonas sp.]|nr:hypothetical protein [Nitrosomonas sp.]
MRPQRLLIPVTFTRMGPISPRWGERAAVALIGRLIMLMTLAINAGAIILWC